MNIERSENFSYSEIVYCIWDAVVGCHDNFKRVVRGRQNI